VRLPCGIRPGLEEDLGLEASLSMLAGRYPAAVTASGISTVTSSSGLVVVPINDIDLPAGSDTLYAATYGRSVWTTSLADAS
jgi:hypothetical protein